MGFGIENLMDMYSLWSLHGSSRLQATSCILLPIRNCSCMRAKQLLNFILEAINIILQVSSPFSSVLRKIYKAVFLVLPLTSLGLPLQGGKENQQLFSTYYRPQNVLVILFILYFFSFLTESIMRARYHRLEGTKEFGVSENFVQNPSSVLLVA